MAVEVQTQTGSPSFATARNVPPQEEKSLGELFSDLTRESSNLVRQEVNLAKAELTQKAAKVGKDAILIAAGGFIAYAGALVLFAAIVALLGPVAEQGFPAVGLLFDPARLRVVAGEIGGLGAHGVGNALDLVTGLVGILGHVGRKTVHGRHRGLSICKRGRER